MLVYEVEVAAPTDADVATRRLSIKVNGRDGGTIDTPGNTVKFGGLKFDEGDQVELHLVDIDDAGNQSPPAVCKFKAHDTIAPGIPAGFSVTLSGEMPSVPAPIQPAAHVVASSKLDKGVGGDKVGPAESKTNGKGSEGDKVGPLASRSDDKGGDGKTGPLGSKVDGKGDEGTKVGPEAGPDVDLMAPESGRARKE